MVLKAAERGHVGEDVRVDVVAAGNNGCGDDLRHGQLELDLLFGAAETKRANQLAN